jgi:hypothetical protein
MDKQDMESRDARIRAAAPALRDAVSDLLEIIKACPRCHDPEGPVQARARVLLARIEGTL